MKNLSYLDVSRLAFRVSEQIKRYMNSGKVAGKGYLDPWKCYPVPRGGIPAAYAIHLNLLSLQFVAHPTDADFFIDDLIDSGATMERLCDAFPGKPFFALIDKRTDEEFKSHWITFPWEVNEDTGIKDQVTRLIQFAGDDPTREGLRETPGRVAKAWQHWCSGYQVNIASLFKAFEDGASGYDQMVIVKDIPIYSKCEHHLADIFGTCTIAYIPNKKIVGLSKLSRVADAFARRLQVQERLTSQIADALDSNLNPLGVGVMIRARHMCMESRGICQQGHHTITTALRGVFRTESDTRAEFMRIA